MRQELDLNTKVPVLSWAKPEDIDSGSLEQIKNLANLPFAYHHVALMPDVHVGYGMPIGGVLASVDYIVPNAVGVDIGCGMVAVKTSITKEEFLALRGEVGHEISRAIPRGFRKYSEPQDEDNEIFKNIPPIDLILREIGNAKLQLGTLGSGNHFIDVLFDENNFIWIMLHSGSRNIGKQIADYYNKNVYPYIDEGDEEETPGETEIVGIDSIVIGMSSEYSLVNPPSGTILWTLLDSTGTVNMQISEDSLGVSIKIPSKLNLVGKTVTVRCQAGEIVVSKDIYIKGL